MGPEAQSPEEVEALLEDAFVTRDTQAVSAMFAEGEAHWWFGGLAVIKATGADTGGQMTGR